jgi:hypothetical protein
MKVKLIIGAAVVVHALAFVLMLRKVDPFYHLFYSFAWWTYILAISGVNHLKARNSLILDDPKEALRVFLFSTPWWLLFEIYNFRIHNWSYMGVPIEKYIRWPGYFVAFGTVLPGVFETRTLLANLGLPRRLRGRPILIRPSLLWRFVLIGLLMMIGAAVAPLWMFPFVWVGLIFLLDPLLYRSSARDESFSAQAEKGDYTLAAQFILAGMVCGLLWEFWNFWAGSKWVYSVPKLGFLKVFEMPMLGFFGFPFFALECYLGYRLFTLLRVRYVQGRPLVRLVALLLCVVYCLIVFGGIDRRSILTFSL